MFSKAKRFEALENKTSKQDNEKSKTVKQDNIKIKSGSQENDRIKTTKQENENTKSLFQGVNKPFLKKHETAESSDKKQERIKPIKTPMSVGKLKPGLTKPSFDVQSQCSSSHSCKSFATPKPIKFSTTAKFTSSIMKKVEPTSTRNKNETHNELIKAQEVEIRNKDHTISEYTKQIEEFKNRISQMETQMKQITEKNLNKMDNQLSQLTIKEIQDQEKHFEDQNRDSCITIENLKLIICDLENQCKKLEDELTEKQLQLKSVEEIIVIRDSLCQDLQQKLSNAETDLDESRQRLEMVKGHHALALEANESIRREYKVELETLKLKLDEEKQSILNKSKSEQENIKMKYNSLINNIKDELLKEKDDAVEELHKQLLLKDSEMRAKLEQIDEATREKLRLCEIQFEERSQHIHDLHIQQQKEIQYLETEIAELKYNITLAEDDKMILQKEINKLRKENDSLVLDKHNLGKERDEIKEESKRKLIDFENEINKLTVEVDKAVKDKNKFETSLSVTRDIVEVLTLRLRESDNELEGLEDKVQTLQNSKEILESELENYKSTLNNTVMECNEYKEALVNILKSKAALAKEHNRIMEHNVSLIESLQNVEKEAYRELGSIKNELIEDVELLKKESNSQIKLLREEVEKKRVLCELAKEHAGQATVAAEQSRVLLAQAAAEINRLETENQCLQQQIQDQQSLVVELSLLRQENEELTMTVAKQSSIIDKMKKESEQIQYKPKSPSVMRKPSKLGKENIHSVISPLRERNH